MGPTHLHVPSVLSRGSGTLWPLGKKWVGESPTLGPQRAAPSPLPGPQTFRQMSWQALRHLASPAGSTSYTQHESPYLRFSDSFLFYSFIKILIK